MMKLLFTVVFLLGVFAEAATKSYSCQLALGGTPRYGATQIHYTFDPQIGTSRLNVTFVGGDGEFLLKDVRVYTHTGNVGASSRYEGYGKFAPSNRYELNDEAHLKFPEFYLSREEAPVLVFSRTRGAVYRCLAN